MSKLLLVIIMIGVTAFVGFLIFIIGFDNPPNHLPTSVNIADLAYKTVEPTGIYGSAEYYVITKDGTRYEVSRKLYDSLIDLPTSLEKECP